MKFLYSHRTRAGDGQRVHIDSMIDALIARGHEVNTAERNPIITAPTGRLNANDERGLRAFLPAPVYECAEYGYSVPAYWRLMEAAKQTAPDILYERANLFYQSGVWTKRRLGLPMMLEVNAPLAQERASHDGLALKGFARRCEQAVWRAADVVLPVSEALAACVRDAGVPEDRIAVIHNGVDDSFLKPADPSPVRARYALEGKLVLGFTGFVRDWHGLDRAVRYLAEAGREDLRLFVVGDGPARAGLEALAADLGVAERIVFTGVVQRAAMAEHVAAFNIALQPAATDYASPLKLFEYMAQAKAILAPDQPNIREALEDRKDALLFAPGGFDAGLSALIGDASLRARLGASARETLIRRDFTWAGNARRVEAIAERLKGKAT